jgi:hypothetical protein
MLKKIVYIPLIFLSLSIFLNSCSVKTQQPQEISKPTCEDRFKEVLEYSKQDFIKAKVKGRLLAEGITLTFLGNVGENTKLDFYLPFGKKILSLNSQGDNLCVIYNGKKVCNKDRVLLKKVLKVDVPYSFKELISGRYRISPNAKYSCENGNLKVINGETTLIYKGLKPYLVKYKDYTIEYVYRNDMIPEVVYINQKNKEKLKIKILKVKK